MIRQAVLNLFRHSESVARRILCVSSEILRFAQNDNHHTLELVSLRKELKLLPRICVASLLLFFGGLGVTPTLAAGEFETSYDVTYTVSSDGTTTVHQRISLTNKTREFYASEHELDIGEAEISDVWAKDPSGPLSPQVLEDSGRKVIKVKFGSPVTGKGQTLVWELGYQTNVARRLGRIWRIDLPGVAQTPETTSYKLTLRVPKLFEDPIFISPTPAARGATLEELWFEFEKVQLEQGGVRAGFGDYQAFDLNLEYYLENPLSQKAYVEIPLPPDILGRQRVVLESLSPLPEGIQIDDDGNYLAKFLLFPDEQKMVRFLGKVFVYPPPVSMDGMTGDIPDNLREKYTTSQEFWEVGDEEIISKAQALTDSGKSVSENVRSIYEYVVAHLSYDKERVGEDFERFGAAKALAERDRALCTEYTDLFITLARAAGIPARLLEGYAYTENSEDFLIDENALHAWVEVYLPGLGEGEGGWQQIDPTWGSTTGGSDYLDQFDLSHITFVRKGLSSVEPCLAVAESAAGTGAWMKISFSEEVDDVVAELKAQVAVSRTGLSGWEREGVVTVRNPGPVTAFDVKVEFVPKGVGFGESRRVELGAIAPWSEKDVEFEASSKFFEETEGSIETRINWSEFSGERAGTVLETELIFLPFWKYIFSWWGLVLLGCGLFGAGFWLWRRSA